MCLQNGNEMKFPLRKLILSVASVMSLSAFAPDTEQFTPAERQQVSIATPHLFDKSDQFYIDFKKLSSTDYCFPLPVGKSILLPQQELEIRTSKGDAVKAMFEGTVRLSKRNAAQIPVLVIRHKNGLETVYSHQVQNLVKVGEHVRAGQTIAIIGERAGRSFLRFSIMVNGARINPTIILSPVSHQLYSQLLQFKKVGHHIDVKVVTEEQQRVGVDPENPFKNSNSFQLNLSEVRKTGQWAYPLPGAKVISPYGGRRGHGGVDLKTKPKDKIVAAFDGVVTLSGPHYGYGNCIKIKHKYGFETLYSHQSKNFVKVGQKVKAGDVIGLTGRTGRATTAHLHFEVKYRGRRYNPNILFDHAKRSLQDVTLTLTKSGKITSKRNKTNAPK